MVGHLHQKLILNAVNCESYVSTEHFVFTIVPFVIWHAICAGEDTVNPSYQYHNDYKRNSMNCSGEKNDFSLNCSTGRKKNMGRSDAIPNMPAPLPNPAKLGGTTSYQHSSSQGGVSGTYGTRSQHQVSQVPYVPHQQGGDYVGQSDSLTR